MVQPHVRSPQRCGILRRCFMAFVLTCALLVGPALSGVEFAHAAQNNGIVLSPATKIVKGSAGVPEPGQALFVNDSGLLQIEWDASAANPQPGDSFSIELAEAFTVREQKTSPMLDGQNQEIGSCQLTSQKVVCTLGNLIVGYQDLKGSLQMELVAVKAAAEDALVFNLNGKPTKISTDAGKGVGNRAKPALPDDLWGKVITPIGGSAKKLNWEIRFMGKTIEQNVDNPDEWSFTDELGPGQVFGDQAVLLRVAYTTPDGNRIDSRQVLDVSSPGATGGYELIFNKTGERKATFTVKGKLDPRALYHVLYSSTPKTSSGVVQKGFSYENTAYLGSRKASATRTYVESFSATVQMKKGFGTFSILKGLTGDGASLLSDGPGFTVKVGWKLPKGKTVADYPGWAAPQENPTTLEVFPGRAVGFQPTFPNGTEVTLSEDLGTASPKNPRIGWGPPVFKAKRGVTIESDGSARLTVAQNVDLRLELINEAKLGEGTFAVSKTLSGAGAATLAGSSYRFTYHCTDGSSGELIAKAGMGEVTAATRHAYGVECTVTEDPASAERAGYRLTAPGPQQVVIAAGTPQVLTFDNSYASRLGHFSIAKTVTGGPFTKDSFSFDYTCGAETGTLQVPGDGTVVTSKAFPVGVTCAVKERPESAVRNGYSVASTLSASSATIVEGTVVPLQATNAYTRDKSHFTIQKKVTASSGADFSKDTYQIGYRCENDVTGVLQVRGDGTPATGPELPTGTRCTISESEATKVRKGHSVSTTIDNPSFTITKDKIQAVVVTNRYTRQTGAINITKALEGDGAGVAPAEYVIRYVCVDYSNAPTVNGMVTLKAGDSATIQTVPTGQCYITEDEAAVPSAKLETSFWINGTESGASKATVPVSEGGSVAVVVKNTYTLLRSGFSITKNVTGEDTTAHANRRYMFNYTCQTPEGKIADSVSLPGSGESVIVRNDLPHGSQCDVSEQSDSAKIDGYSVKLPKDQQVTISHDQSKNLSFTNEYTRERGAFSIIKTLKGASEHSGREFTFHYTCDDNTRGSLRVKGDGTATPVGITIPTGVACTVREDLTTARIDGYTLAPPSDQVVRVSTNETTLTFVNAYTKVNDPNQNPTDPDSTVKPKQPNPSPSIPSAQQPKPEEQPEGKQPLPGGTRPLPRTDGKESAISLAALAMLGLMGASLIRRRKH